MLLHNVPFEDFNIACEDTLQKPKHNGKFELIVSNMPYSVHWEGDLEDPRFAPAGVLAPSTKADLAFVMHILAHLEDTAAIVCFNGVMYRGGPEREIRKYILDYVDAVIQLPNKLFYGTSITTCILVLKKHKTDKKVLFLDASEECEKKGKKYLTKENIDNIVEEYKERRNSKVSYLFDREEIEKGSLSNLYYTEQPFWNIDTLFYTIINTELIIPKYLYFALKQAHLEQYNTAGGGPSLTKKIVNDIEIPVTDLRIQEQIVEELERVEKLIDSLQNEANESEKQLLEFEKILFEKSYLK